MGKKWIVDLYFSKSRSYYSFIMNNNKKEPARQDIFQSKMDKLKEIDELYRLQLQDNYVNTKSKL